MKYIIVIISASLLFSCSTQNKSDNTKVSKKEVNTETTDIVSQLHDIWALEEISNQKIEELGEFARRPQLEIFVKDMLVAGNDGCNQFSGSIKELNENQIILGPLIGTKMACENMNISNKFNIALSKVTNYKREGLKLFLLDNKGSELLQFQKID